jgi:hypothetical protein
MRNKAGNAFRNSKNILVNDELWMNGPAWALIIRVANCN